LKSILKKTHLLLPTRVFSVWKTSEFSWTGEKFHASCDAFRLFSLKTRFWCEQLFGLGFCSKTDTIFSEGFPECLKHDCSHQAQEKKTENFISIRQTFFKMVFVAESLLSYVCRIKLFLGRLHLLLCKCGLSQCTQSSS